MCQKTFKVFLIIKFPRLIIHLSFVTSQVRYEHVEMIGDADSPYLHLLHDKLLRRPIQVGDKVG